MSLENNKVYIYNLSPLTTMNELMQLFRPFGSILSIRNNPDESYAIVEYAFPHYYNGPSVTERVVRNMDHQLLHGNIISVRDNHN